MRALAILFVLFRHGVRPFWKEGETLLPLGGWDFGIPLINGWVGVDLFFVLSGFLITHHICGRYRRRDGRIDFKRLSVAPRPAHRARLLCGGAAGGVGLVPYLQVEPGLMPFRIAYHLLFLQDYLPSNLLATFWSLGVEEKFYLLSPLLLMAVFRLPRPAQQYAAIAALCGSAYPHSLRDLAERTGRDRLPDVLQDVSLPLPCQLRRTGDGHALRPALPRPGRPALDGRPPHRPWAVLAGRRDLRRCRRLRAAAGSHRLLRQGAAAEPALDQRRRLLLLGLILKGGPGQIFRSRPLLVLSRLAYSLYLVHLALLPAVQAFCDSLPFFDGLSRGAQFLVFLPPYLLIATAAALVLHYGVEKPFLLLRERRPAAA